MTVNLLVIETGNNLLGTFSQKVIKQNTKSLWRYHTHIAVVIVISFAFSLRLHDVSSVPVGGDEFQTIVAFANLPFVEIFSTYHSNNHPLASALAHLFSPQADHLFMLRWPSILIGMMALPFIYRLSSDVFGRKIGVLSLFLLAVSPIHLNYSVVVRGYVGIITATIISLYFLRRVLVYDSLGAWFGLVTVNIVIAFFHLYGVMAAWMQLGLVSLWMLWTQISGSRNSGVLHKSILFRHGVTIFFVGTAHTAIAYVWTQEILSNEVWGGEFDVWRDGVFSLPQDTSPLIKFVSQMTLWPPFGAGFFMYAIFFVVGFVFLWQQQRILALFTLFWFIGPFIGILLATQLLPRFYTYVRFLVFLLPTFLVIVAIGMITTIEKLLSLGRYRVNHRSIIYGLKGGFVVSVLTVIIISINWHFSYSNGNYWQGVANQISTILRPNDIVVCEEGHGFDVPNQPRDYCVRMLDFLVSQLEKYSPNLQSSTNHIANYKHIFEQRNTMLQPGTVWLVLWNQTPFDPGEFVANPAQLSSSPPPPTAFQPYDAWQFGSATLVRVDSEATLLDNIQRTLELLVQLDETSLADKSRFYRSLAEIEAVQGHKMVAQTYFDRSWATVEQAGGQYPDLFLLDTLPLIERIPPDEALPDVETVFISAQFGDELCLSGLQISAETASPGQTVEIGLHWQTLDFVDKDYLYHLVIHDQAGDSVGRIASDPFKRVYPTTWWWPGDPMVDRILLTVPPELAGQTYTVSLELVARSTRTGTIRHPLFQLQWMGDHWSFETQEITRPECISGE